MRTLRQTIFAFAMVASLAFGVAAQSDDQKRPPKDPKIIKPGEKDRPRPPKGGEKPPKKPGSAFYLV